MSPDNAGKDLKQHPCCIVCNQFGVEPGCFAKLDGPKTKIVKIARNKDGEYFAELRIMVLVG